jgi:hypothetical protein
VALTAARRPWNPLLHPRGADGRFIEVGSWVRWLRQGFGSTRRGQVKEILPDPKAKTKDGVPTKVIARVEFPDRDGKTILHDVPFEELEKVAPPKGSVNEPGPSNEDDETKTEGKSELEKTGDTIARKIAAKTVGHLIRDDEHHVGDNDSGVGGTEDGNDTLNRLGPEEQKDVEDAVEDAVEEAIEETVPDTPQESTAPSDEQLEAEELANLGDDPVKTKLPEDGGHHLGQHESTVDPGLIETPFVPPSDEWEKTSEWFVELQEEDTPVADAIINELHPDAFESTSEWADAVRLARARYEGWRAAQIAQDPDADVSLEAYLNWLEEKGLKAALVAGLRADARVRGSNSLLARATEYWTEEKRKEAAKSGIALPNGKYPIEDKEDLKKSIAAYGRATDPPAVKRHIMRRASMIGELDMIPDDWAGSPGFDPARHLRGPDGKFISQGGKPRRSSAFVASTEDAKTTAEVLRGRVHGSS